MAAGNQTQPKQSNNIQRRRVNTVRPTSRDTITVGCKLPHGMHLDIREPGKPVQRVTLRGIYTAKKSDLIIPAQRGGFAVTPHVPKEFFEHWMELNKNHPAVQNGLIFHHRQEASVIDMAEERDEVLNGLEPIDPTKPGNKIETANFDD